VTIYKVTLTSVLDGDPTNPFVNVFGYDCDTFVPSVGPWEAFAEAFQDQVIDNVRALCCEQMHYVKLALVGSGPTAPAFEWIYSPARAGQADSTQMPKFVAWGFQYDRASVGQRSGAKRFGVISENSVTNGVATGGMAAPLAACALALASPITTGITDVFTPKILHKTGADTFEGHDVAGVRYIRVTTQNSRKR